MNDRLFEDAILRLMGCQAIAPSAQNRTVQVLMLPSFHPACCFIVEDRGSTIDFGLIILRDRRLVHEVFMAFWRDENAARSMTVSKGVCWEDIVALTPTQANHVRDLYAHAHPTTLKEIGLYGIDGIGIRLRYWGPEGEHSIGMWSPKQTRHPVHQKWMVTLVDLAHASFADPYAQAYLGERRRYFA